MQTKEEKRREEERKHVQKDIENIRGRKIWGGVYLKKIKIL